jgi:hemolysin activation/secretion protein
MPVCRFAGIPARRSPTVFPRQFRVQRLADWKVGDTADRNVCATQTRLPLPAPHTSPATHHLFSVFAFPIFAFRFSLFCSLLFALGPSRAAAAAASGASYLYNSYEVRNYVIEGKTLPATNVLARPPAQYTGTNVCLADIVSAAVDLQKEYRRQGLATMNIVIAPKRITNGVVTLDVFPGAVAQIVLAGERYLMSTNGLESGAAAQITTALTTRAAAARAATNRFTVEKYLVTGNTILPPATIGQALAAATNAYGTNVTLAGILAARNELQAAFQNRGLVTVGVGIPAGQKLSATNTTVKLQVTEGRLAAIEVKGNHYFSSNNIMRALPDLHTNELLNGKILQEEVNRANANQDRQIYPVIGPGPDPGTSELALNVKDQLPIHGKVELNNQSSPGTPDLRVNSSAVYNNLWQQEQSLGLQYTFSPQVYKTGPQWAPYDQPLVATYSGFYRIPLECPESIEEVIASQSGGFGYDEATHKFNLPPATGQPDLTFFASRSAIDTGLTTAPNQNLYTSTTTNVDGSVTTNSTLNLSALNQNLTINNDLGFRLSLPLVTPGGFHSDWSGGLDFKTYSLTSAKTNFYLLNSSIIDTVSGTVAQTNQNSSTDTTPVAGTVNQLEYLPLSLRYDANWQDCLGAATAGLGLNANLWYYSVSTQGSGTNTSYLHGVNSLRDISGSVKSSGYWVVLNPGFSQQLNLVPNWPTTLRADGQWASEPLISNEQFGAGGVNSVRGYHEGQVFGDCGWHVTLEQQTPPHRVGFVDGNVPLIVRGTVYMDYADTYLLDPTPTGRAASTDLWGTGFGGVASIGSHWEARFLFSVPLLGAGGMEAYQPFFNFSLTAQF